MKYVYEAEWISRIKRPPMGKDFDPTRDVNYCTRQCDTFEEAKAAALSHETSDLYAEVYTYAITRRGRRSLVTKESVL